MAPARTEHDSERSGGWQGYFLDTEGNTFGVHQPDANAK
jgi:predicted enzyme related to lactoylglutathione lyase